MRWFLRFFAPAAFAGSTAGIWWAALPPRAPATAASARGPAVVAPPRAESIRLLAVGDLMLGTDVAVFPESKGALHPFAPAQPLLGAADLTFGNLETPLSDRGSATPGKSADSLRRGTNYLFRAPPAYAAGLAEAGFDVVDVANNHAMDYRGVALLDTLRHLRAAGVAPVGGGRNLAEALEPVVLTRGGIRVAFLGISDVLPAYSVAGKSRPGIAAAPRGAPDPRLARAVARARREADHVVVAVHWGIERHTTASARQKALGRQLVRWGAHVVLGSHPHVLQPVERYRGALIHYSLGNFITYVGNVQPSDALEVVLRPGGSLTYRRIPFDLRGGQAFPRIATRIARRVGR